MAVAAALLPQNRAFPYGVPWFEPEDAVAAGGAPKLAGYRRTKRF
jgi:hypothetical protein